jgi:hypothetical protein
MHPGDVVLNHASTVRGAVPVSGLSEVAVDAPPSAVDITPTLLWTPAGADFVLPAWSTLRCPEESA